MRVRTWLPGISIGTRGWLWCTFNISGIALFLFDSSRLWNDIQLPGAGDGIYWVIFIAPILLVCSVVNLFALAHVIRTRKNAPRVRAALWAVIACAWMIALFVDTKMQGEPCKSDVCLHG